MSLVRIDGWDYYPPNSTGFSVVGPNFQADGFVAGLNNWTTSTGRFGGQCIQLGANFVSIEPIGRRFTSQTVTFGHAVGTFYGFSDLMYGTVGFYDAEGATFMNCGIRFEEDGVIRVIRGSGSSGATNAFTYVATSKAKAVHSNEWNYIEIKVKISSGSGLVEVRVNNVTVVSYVGPTTNSNIPTPILGLDRGFDSIIYVGGPKLDDRYILTDEGTDNIDYLGNVRVNTQLTVGAGALTEMDVFGAASNWDAVNEFVLTDVEYVYTSVDNERDLYAMNPSITAQNILGVQVVGAWKQDDATQKAGATLLRTGGSVFEGTPQNLSTGYKYYREIYDLNPDTGVGWTAAELNAIQAGQKLLAV